MKLLIFTQALDRNDSTLSVYHDWILAIARKFEQVTVICLKKGDHDAPANVRVLSLGKEAGASRLRYVWNFYRYVVATRHSYDAVFVHMNQEYILLGGLLWKLFGKNIYMWRNHHAGNILTDIAAGFCKHVFCTSKFSYTAKYKKTIIMPVGIDTNIFKKIEGGNKVSKSILFLARIAPVKKPHVLVRALKVLADKGVVFTAEIYGDPLPKDTAYYNSLKQTVVNENLSDKVSFHAGVPNTQTVSVYNAHDIFVNLSSSGMYDKTIFEAMACETLVLASNKNLHGLIGEEYIFEEENAVVLADKLEHLLALSTAEKQTAGSVLRNVVVREHSLAGLADKLTSVIS